MGILEEKWKKYKRYYLILYLMELKENFNEFNLIFSYAKIADDPKYDFRRELSDFYEEKVSKSLQDLFINQILPYNECERLSKSLFPESLKNEKILEAVDLKELIWKNFDVTEKIERLSEAQKNLQKEINEVYQKTGIPAFNHEDIVAHIFQEISKDPKAPGFIKEKIQKTLLDKVENIIKKGASAYAEAKNPADSLKELDSLAKKIGRIYFSYTGNKLDEGSLKSKIINIDKKDGSFYRRFLSTVNNFLKKRLFPKEYEKSQRIGLENKKNLIRETAKNYIKR